MKGVQNSEFTLSAQADSIMAILRCILLIFLALLWLFISINIFIMSISILYIYIYLFIYLFLGPHLQHMEVPRLGVQLELQLPAYPKPQQGWNWVRSAIYNTAHCNARSLTHWAGPGVELESSWILVGWVSAEPRRELPQLYNTKFRWKNIIKGDTYPLCNILFVPYMY